MFREAAQIFERLFSFLNSAFIPSISGIGGNADRKFWECYRFVVAGERFQELEKRELFVTRQFNALHLGRQRRALLKSAFEIVIDDVDHTRDRTIMHVWNSRFNIA